MYCTNGEAGDDSIKQSVLNMIFSYLDDYLVFSMGVLIV